MLRPKLPCRLGIDPLIEMARGCRQWTYLCLITRGRSAQQHHISMGETLPIVPTGVTAYSRKRDLMVTSYHLWSSSLYFENRCLIRGNGHCLSLLFLTLWAVYNLAREEYIYQTYQSRLLRMDLKGPHWTTSASFRVLWSVTSSSIKQSSPSPTWSWKLMKDTHLRCCDKIMSKKYGP